MTLTPRRLEALRLICAHANKHGAAPSAREVAAALGTTAGTAHYVMGALVRRKLLARDGRKHRTLTVTEAGWRVAGVAPVEHAAPEPIGTAILGQPIPMDGAAFWPIVRLPLVAPDALSRTLTLYRRAS